jgi:putative chitinase
MRPFFNLIRSELFGGKLTAKQVDGIEFLLSVTEGLSLPHRAYLLATVFHETAATMQPIFERGHKAYFDKYEPGTRIGRDLGNTRPGDGFLFRGRGYVQITGRDNYRKASERLRVDLVAFPDEALKPEIAAKILVRGCLEGWFTGATLADFDSYADMRRVVNGRDRAVLIAGHAEAFERAMGHLRRAGSTPRPPAPPPALPVPPPALPDPEPPAPPPDVAVADPVAAPPSGGFFMRLWRALSGGFR